MTQAWPTRAAIATLTMLYLAAVAVADDDWPARQPIHLIAPYAAGGYSDFTARNAANFMSRALSAQVIVENRPGAAGVIGTQVVAKAPPDGHWLCICGSGSITLAPAIEGVPYDPLKDVVPVSLINTVPLFLIVNRDPPPHTLAEFIAWAKSKPSGLTYGSSGTGGTMHIAGEVFRNRTGLNMIHVPYRGSGLTSNALVAGEIDTAFVFSSDIMGLLQAKTVRPLAISTARRSPYFPDIPTVMEQGIADFDFVTWNGLFAPAGVPKPIMDKLAAVMADMVKSPEILKVNAEFGASNPTITPDEFAAQLRTDAVRWKQYLSGVVVKN